MAYYIKYGYEECFIDISNFCNLFLRKNDYILIPKGDNLRVKLFSDPLAGYAKFIIIIYNNIINMFDHCTDVIIDLNNNKIYESKTYIPDYIINLFNSFIFPHVKLENIQNKLIIKHGSFHDEYPEQLLTALFLSGNEKVLEIGSNIGRNSLIIGNILREKKNNNFVTLESDPISFEKLRENRNMNNLYFHIENSALSKRKLIQKDWNTIISDVVEDGWTTVNTITYNELKKKYNIEFDTLIADCEGALLIILLDMPELLENINLIIMENDFIHHEEKTIVNYILNLNRFKCIFSRPIDSGCLGMKFPCSNSFYEVWKK
jgi:FkbM family methyltransferase